MKTDIVIVGCGVSGLYCALNLPPEKKIILITKSEAEKSDSFLAQGGICVLRDEEDHDSFFEDTLKAGHYENDRQSVEIMIGSSREVINDLLKFGVEFERSNGELIYTREGAHSKPRILFHKDITGKEITSRLLSEARSRKNITLIENCTMTDLVVEDVQCIGITVKDAKNEFTTVYADYTVLATGGIGGLFKHSTNFPHLTGDALALAIKHGIALQDIDYIQIHPTTLFTDADDERSFLISESVRGEGAVLLNSSGDRFVNELLPRDVVTEAIFAEMQREGSDHVYLSFAPMPREEIEKHFPNIKKHCLQKGYDITKEPIPIVPAQHYFMGGIKVDQNSATSMNRLFAVGETACNGVHGRNRLASNSLLESLVFAKRAALEIASEYSPLPLREYKDTPAHSFSTDEYKKLVLDKIEEAKKLRINKKEKVHE